MATKQAPKGGSGEQKKVAAPPHNAKEKESPKELVKDDKANLKAGGKDPPKESKDANKKPIKEDKKEPVQSGSSSGGGQERGRSGRQDDHARGKDRGTRTPRDRPDHRTQDKDGREVCRNFLHNRCDRGSLCKYYHPRSTSRPRHGPDDPEHRRNSPTRAPGTGGGQIICRDFIRNMCSRGTECRFYHPPTETTTKKRQGSWLTFCHDFRNGHCVRNDCRFFHITREDEESYRATGEIPLHIVDQTVRKAMVLDGALTGTRPTCKEFLRGLCNMQNCRFRHLSQREYEDEVFHALQDEFENVLGPPDRRPSSPQVINNPYAPIGNFIDPNRKYAPQGEFVEEMMPVEDMRGPLLPMSEYESDPKRPRYFSGDARFPGEEYRDGGEPPRKWDDRMEYDRMERTDLNPRDPYRLPPDIYGLRNENVEIRRTAEREINDLKEEVRRTVEENVGLRHEVAKVRTTAAEEALDHKATMNKLTLTNNSLMEDLRKAEETVRRMEQENQDNLKAMDAKQKNNCMEMEHKINNLEKEISQLRDVLNDTSAAQKKAEDEKERVLSELDDMRLKMRGQGGLRSEQHSSNSSYNSKSSFPRDPDHRSHSLRGSERYSPEAWSSSDKNGLRGGEDDRSRSWHGAPPPQDSWSPHGGAKSSSTSLMGEYQGDDRMRAPAYSSSGGSGLLSLPIDVARAPQGGQGGQMGIETQYSGQSHQHRDDWDYNASNYDTEGSSSQFGHSQWSSSPGWQQGGDGGRGRAISQSWRRDKQF